MANYQKNKKVLIIGAVSLLIIAFIIAAFLLLFRKKEAMKPENVVLQYTNLLNEKKYGDMYGYLNETAKLKISSEDFVERNQNIYEGIEARDIEISIVEVIKPETDTGPIVVRYDTTMTTIAGSINFTNEVELDNVTDEKDNVTYKINWDSSVIFPDLADTDKVRVSTKSAKRGSIYDRNGVVLAEQGIASNVGIVPGRLGRSDGTFDEGAMPEALVQSQAETIEKIAGLLDMPVDSINSKISASYVKSNTFVELKAVPQDAWELKAKLLEIPGIMIKDTEARVYPQKEKAAHLTGYVGSITAEEMEALKADKYPYTANSIIGKNGLEKAYEERLRCTNGYLIYIENEHEHVKVNLAETTPQNGEDIKLTIDSNLQNQLYGQLNGDAGCAVAMNPENGEVLAMVSTPAYDPNDFALGISTGKWEELSNREDTPMFSRFQSTLCPGSTFKPITGASALTAGKLDPNEDFGHSGLTWKKDDSWGEYYIKTTQETPGSKNLENSLVYSDNIYFGKVALTMGADSFTAQLKNMGFGESIPFAMHMSASSFSQDGNTISSEIKLADSGFGQGEILVNPLHLASMFSAFINQGSMIAPSLEYSETPSVSYWKENAISAKAAETVKKGLIQVVDNPNGTGASAKIAGHTLLGKTGTAELKSSKDETGGKELGWFIAETAEGSPKPLLAAAMVEDVQGRGGSKYVIPVVKSAFETYLQ